jgi:tRNA (guanine37-N1)-methyltransferase
VFNQEITKSLARENHLVLICGHYEGVDERVREKLVDEEISIGDFVLTGGEIPAMAVVDAVARMIPGVLGEEESFKSDSFYDGWLKYPQYTRPREYQGIGVPEVLLSGDHEKIRLWRRKMSLLRTLQKRPELFNRLELSEEDKKLMENEDGGAES